MRLVAFADAAGERRIGVWTDAGVRDLTVATGARDVGQLLAGSQGMTQGLEGVVGDLHDASSIRVLAPIGRPGKIICVGLNYHDHCREQDIPPPERPILFAKFANAVADPGAAVLRPRATEKLDLECELAAIVGRRLSRAAPDEALAAVFGYTIVNDVTMRDLQAEERQWLRAKGADGFAPMGPVVVTPDELGDVRALRVRSSVNGETWQDSSTAEMVFDVGTLLAFASRVMTLEPGDVVATGTPAGVGHFADPPRYVVDGDVMRCEISGIGVLENRVVDERLRATDHAEAAGVGELLTTERVS